MAHAWVVGQVPSGGCTRDNHTLVFLSLSSSLPLSLKINKLKKKEKAPKSREKKVDQLGTSGPRKDTEVNSLGFLSASYTPD